MKLLGIFFIFLAYGVFVAMYNTGESESAPDFPVFDAPEANFVDIPDDCSGFFDCTEYVGNVLKNIVLGVIYVVLLIVALLVFIIAFLALVAESAFSGIEGMPGWANALIVGVLGAAIAIIAYRAFRQGDTDTS
jgi:di/tricarboxylate transporter